MITVKLYSRKDCQLCDQARADLEALKETIPHQLVEVDIDQDNVARKKFGDLVPVVEVGPYHLKPPFNRQELQITMGAVQLGQEQDQKIAQARATTIALPGMTWTRADRFSAWLSRHYLAVLNTIVLIYVGLPFLAPVFMKAGITGPAYAIYKAYGAVCHQLAFRSWFLFGEQDAYPRAAAGVPGLIPFSQATGIPDGDLVSARNFIGNPTIGYKIAFCERDVSIYGAILVFGLLYGLTRNRLPGGKSLPPMPWYAWAIIGILPIGLDGFSQLLSQPPFSFSFLPYRESTPFLRFLTGSLFGFTTAWFGYPLVEESMADSRRILDRKWKALFGERIETRETRVENRE